jgi:hypothetical protein
MYKVKHLLLLAAACAASLVVTQSAAAGAPDVVCSGVFSGTARDLTVPDQLETGVNCVLEGATITRNVIVEEDGFLAAANTTIGHDLIASKPQVLTTGFTEDGGGPVTVGHDLVLNGQLTDRFGNHTCCPGINDATIGHDLRITDLLVDFEIFVQRDKVGHDLVVTGNLTGICCGFGPIGIGDNSVGHDLVVANNTAPGGDFGWISVYENTVEHDATCANNDPPESKNSPGQVEFLGRLVRPNIVGHTDSCD